MYNFSFEVQYFFRNACFSIPLSGCTSFSIRDAFSTTLPMTSGQMRFLPAVEMTVVSRENMEGGAAAASPPLNAFFSFASPSFRDHH